MTRTRTFFAVLVMAIITSIVASTPTASAHHPEIEGTTSRPCGPDSEWGIKVTAFADAVRGKEWRSEYKVANGGWSGKSAWQPDSEAFGPIVLGPFPASLASVEVKVRSDWRPTGPTNQTRSITLNRPEAYACPTTTTSTIPPTTTTVPPTSTTAPTVPPTSTTSPTTTTTVPVTTAPPETTEPPVDTTTSTTEPSNGGSTSTTTTITPVTSAPTTPPPTDAPTTPPSLPPTPVPTPPVDCPYGYVPSDIGFCIPPSTTPNSPAERVTTTTVPPALPVTGGTTDMGLFLGTLALFGGGLLTLIARRKATS